MVERAVGEPVEPAGLRSFGEMGSNAYGVGSSHVEAHVRRSPQGQTGFGLDGRVSFGHGAHDGRRPSGQRQLECCILLRCAGGSSWVAGRAWQRLRGLAAAVILWSGAQGHGRQTSTVRAVEVDQAMWKASRSVPEVSGATTKRMS